MLNRRFPLILSAVLALAACSDAQDVARYLIEPPVSGQTVPNRIGTTELREVRLPDYAAGQEIALQAEDGTLRAGPSNIWADDPVLGITTTLARQITAVSGATVIVEPWPLQDLPPRRLEVRIDRMVARNDGRYRLSGQYFLVPVSGSGSDIVRRFDITVPMAAQEYGAIADASARALDTLARQIAQLQ
ncbi:hypothetical protein SAMN04488238_109125 [Roseicitreum antarcticum]|uniref:ABC-type transport auxiliary lipoprotein component domain-containing protein n=1 Tax=Roseicitreum antarcticum TaxID=564137 RepID=A0A1H3CDH4_9RHOB|nr:hypothetical protein SAMN04488238_109125 [Roseicitreum antarcticum]